jgi:hemolysin activation/secretion protein
LVFDHEGEPVKSDHLLKRLPSLLLSVSLLAGIPAISLAQAVPKFPIVRFKVDGNSLLPQSVIDASLQPFIGKERDFGDVQRALEALEEIYKARGYTAVTVLLPEQVLERGEVQLRVIEARIKEVQVEGANFFDKENIRASVPALQEGTIPSVNDYSASLRVANENPAKKITLQLQPGERDEDLIAKIKVSDEKPWKAGLTLDNTGNEQTGKQRLGLSYQHGNLFNRDHVLTAQYQTAPQNPKDVNVYALAYRVPLYGLGDVLDVYTTYSDVNAGVVAAGPFNLAITGKGSSLGAKYTVKLRRMAEYDHEVQLGIDGKLFKNGITTGDVNLGNDLGVRPLSVMYSGRWAKEGQELSFNLGAVRNLPGGSNGDQAAFDKVRAGSSKNYDLIRGGVTFSATLPQDWQTRLVSTAQWASGPLIPGEQFGLGGASSVRGFGEREVSNDKGIQGNLELYTPELCGQLAGQNCRAIAFYDFGGVYRNSPLPSEEARQHISSAGLGLRWSLGRYAAIQADYANVLQGGGTRQTGDWQLHGRIGLFY